MQINALGETPNTNSTEGFLKNKSGLSFYKLSYNNKGDAV